MSKLQTNRIDCKVITRHKLFNTTYTFEYNYVLFIFIIEVPAIYSNLIIYFQNLSMLDFTKLSHTYLLRSIFNLILMQVENQTISRQKTRINVVSKENFRALKLKKFKKRKSNAIKI